jgi:lipopolysaccharide transport system ATP-binding protein
MSYDGAAIRFDGVSKRYARGRPAERSLRGVLFGRRERRAAEPFWALRDVTLEVASGSAVALVGANGAGKSTLLRVAAGLSLPSEGTVAVPPETVSVLGLGAGFDGTLTGAENALTALVVNGLSRRAAKAELDAVRDYAELEDFFESPVRTYSAGMALRLAFAVATRLRADAFLVDEVLSVGDLRFQEKCIAHLNGLRAAGATILMATHDLDQAAALCPLAAWLQAGRIRAIGDAGDVISAYKDAMRSRTLEITPPPTELAPVPGLELRRNRFGSQEVRLEDVRLNGTREASIEPGGALRLDARLVAASLPTTVIIGMSVWRARDQIELVKTHTELGSIRVDQAVVLSIERLDLAPGDYLVDVGAYDADWHAAYDYHWGAYRLHVVGHRRADGGALHPPVRWKATDFSGDAGP